MILAYAHFMPTFPSNIHAKEANKNHAKRRQAKIMPT
jgi:hypothetical protein